MSRRCECGKGAVVFVTYRGGRPTKSCTATIKEYRRKYGPISGAVVTMKEVAR